MNILIGIFLKLIDLFIQGDVNVEVKKEAEIFHGNPNRRDALVDMLRMYYSDKDNIHSSNDSGDIGGDH